MAESTEPRVAEDRLARIQFQDKPEGPIAAAIIAGGIGARKLSTFVRQVGHGFVESAASLIGLLIQAAVGSSGGVGGLRTNRSGWAA
jgi:hypothetical protein